MRVRHRPSGAHPAPAWSRLALALTLLFGLLAGSLGRALPAAAQAATLPDSASLVPDDTLIYLSVNLDLEDDQWAQTQDLLTRVGYPDALTDLRDSILQESGLVDGEAPPDDPLFGGEIAVVVSPAAVDTAIELFEESGGMGMMAGDVFETAPDATPEIAAASPAAGLAPGTPLGVSLIFTPGDPDAAVETIQELIDSEGGEPFDTVEYEGIDIEFQPSQSADGTGTGFAFARLDDSLLLAGTPEDLEPIIDVANGDAPAIADLDELGQVRDQLPSEALLFSFANGQAIGDALPPEAIDALLASTPQYADLGADAFDSSFGLTLSADEPGFRLDAVNIVPADSPLLELMPDTNVELTSDQRVPADTLLFAAGSDLGPTGALNGAALSLAQGVVQTFGEGAATPMPADPFAAFDEEYVESQFEAAEEILGFDLRADLFDQFVGEFTFALSLPGFTAGGLDLNSVFASGLDDEATVADSLTRLARFIDTTTQEEGEDPVDVSTRQIDGDRLYVLRNPETPEAFSAEFGVVGEEVLIGVDSGIDDYLDGPSETLADDPRYQETLATLPEERYQIIYLDVSQIVTLLETTGVLGDDLGAATIDADPACADYDAQADAQEAYDADPFNNAALDQDFDGDACEDFFASATPEAAASPVAAGNPAAIQAFATVGYRGEEEGVFGVSAILYIDESPADS